MLKRVLTEKLHVCSQIRVEEISTLAEQGYSTIINSRPDGEVRGQPTSAEVNAAARSVGIAYLYQPVSSKEITTQEADRFILAVAQAQGKVLAHCRTGTRTATLWALSQRDKQNVDDILATAKQMGYDLEFLRSRLT